MGQLQHPASVDCLLEVLGNKEEHAMVRHEAAEALGSIGGEHVELNEVTKLECSSNADADFALTWNVFFSENFASSPRLPREGRGSHCSRKL
jgi:HEAT repeat protein